MLHYLANNIRDYNNKQIKAAEFFSVIFDESQNLAKKSILAIGERYYDRIKRAPFEVITSYLQLPKQNADTIANALIKQIERNLSVRCLPESAFISCTADGCGTNTGNPNPNPNPNLNPNPNPNPNLILTLKAVTMVLLCS
jgi:hypothetical protein